MSGNRCKLSVTATWHLGALIAKSRRLALTNAVVHFDILRSLFLLRIGLAKLYSCLQARNANQLGK